MKVPFLGFGLCFLAVALAAPFDLSDDPRFEYKIREDGTVVVSSVQNRLTELDGPDSLFKQDLESGLVEEAMKEDLGDMAEFEKEDKPVDKKIVLGRKDEEGSVDFDKDAKPVEFVKKTENKEESELKKVEKEKTDGLDEKVIKSEENEDGYVDEKEEKKADGKTKDELEGMDNSEKPKKPDVDIKGSGSEDKKEKNEKSALKKPEEKKAEIKPKKEKPSAPNGYFIGVDGKYWSYMCHRMPHYNLGPVTTPEELACTRSGMCYMPGPWSTIRRQPLFNNPFSGLHGYNNYQIQDRVDQFAQPTGLHGHINYPFSPTNAHRGYANYQLTQGPWSLGVRDGYPISPVNGYQGFTNQQLRVEPGPWSIQPTHGLINHQFPDTGIPHGYVNPLAHTSVPLGSINYPCRKYQPLMWDAEVEKLTFKAIDGTIWWYDEMTAEVTAPY